MRDSFTDTVARTLTQEFSLFDGTKKEFLEAKDAMDIRSGPTKAFSSNKMYHGAILIIPSAQGPLGVSVYSWGDDEEKDWGCKY